MVGRTTVVEHALQIHGNIQCEIQILIISLMTFLVLFTDHKILLIILPVPDATNVTHTQFNYANYLNFM